MQRMWNSYTTRLILKFRKSMHTLEERAKKFATRNYLNSDGEIVASRVDPEVYENALIVAKAIKQEIIDKACDAYCKVCDTKECEEWGGRVRMQLA